MMGTSDTSSPWSVSLMASGPAHVGTVDGEKNQTMGAEISYSGHFVNPW